MASTGANCIFCSIIAGRIPCHKVFESSRVLAFMDINPLSRGHVLIIPKQHAVRLHEVDETTGAEIGSILVKLSKVVADGTFDKNANASTEYNVLQNNGPLAHQEVQHVHFHIIPKFDTDSGLGIGWKSTMEKLDFAADAELYRTALSKHSPKE